MKSTERFKEVIHQYLKEKADVDPLFSITFKKEGKNIDDCVTYILNTVQKSGMNGFDDEEVYSMAVHYYDEDNIEVGKSFDARVVVNHHVDLTEEEKQKAKEDALEKLKQEHINSMKKKPVTPKKEETETKQQSLF